MAGAGFVLSIPEWRNSMLEVNNVSKSYHGIKVVDGVSFSLKAGEILGMIGSNGAGKSTCISMLATLIKPDSGHIVYKGKDIVETPQVIRAELGYVPQDIALYETLSGLDNLKFWGSSYHIDRNRLMGEIKRVANIIEFDDKLLKKRVSEYSGGMKRRLNIGVALLHNPALVILDEPTTGIDVQSGNQILSSIQELGRQGTAIIFAGHYMEEVERISSHILILAGGKSLIYGELKNLLNRAEGHCSLAELYEEINRTE